MKRKNIKRIIAMLLILIMMIGNSPINNKLVKAENTGENIELQPGLVTTEKLTPYIAAPSDIISISVPVKAINQYFRSPIISVEMSDPALELNGEISLGRKNAIKEPEDIVEYDTTYINFSVKVKENAKASNYGIKITVQALDQNNNFFEVKLKNQILVKVISEKAEPSLTIENVQYTKNLKKGDETQISLDVKNIGELTAKDVKVWVEGYTSDTLTPQYSPSITKIIALQGGERTSIVFPIKVAKDNKGGMQTLTIKASRKDSLITEDTSLYFDIEKTKEKVPVKITGEPNLIVSHVVQRPNIPMAGEELTVSFIIENRSKLDAKNLKIVPTNLATTNFSPIKSQSYIYVGTLEAGTKKKINMHYTVSKTVVEGLNELALQFLYNDKKDTAYDKTAKIYVIDVKNPKKEGNKDLNSKPKLIISKFTSISKGEKVLKAGKTFNFAFDILNTHKNKAANNIKVTLSSEENVFAQTKGSNSIYIASINPGETEHHEVELKIKPDCTTKSYPLTIKFEYEYNGEIKMEQTETTGTVPMEPVTEVINLSVMENSRPVVSSVTVGDYEPAIVNMPTTLNFEFYNMGKSILNNVIARVEGDAFTSSSSIKFIGNVAAGAGDIYDMEVTPNVEGIAKGKLIISYEDSNGDTIEVPTDFEATINPADMGGDPGMENPDMGEPLPDVNAKKPIVNLPIFIIIQFAILIVSIISARKISLSLYRKKKMNEEDEL